MTSDLAAHRLQLFVLSISSGIVVDSAPGIDGYRYFFFVSAAICAIGWAASKGLKSFGEQGFV